MRLAAPLLALALAAGPATAQEAEDDGFNLMEEGARLFFRGLMSEVEPTIEDFRGLAEELEPALRQFSEEMGRSFALLLDRIDDIRYYEAPVILPNGDILIRRKPDAPPFERVPDGEPDGLEDEPGDGGEIDL